MNSTSITSSIGSKATSTEIEALLQTLGIHTQPSLPSGEYNAYLGNKALGVCLLFQDEAYLKDLQVPIGTMPLVLIGAFFYSEGQEGYSQFRGGLPGGVTFEDDQVTVKTKLGPPEWVRERDGVIKSERWAAPPHKIMIDYDKKGTVKLIYFGLI